MIIKGLQETIYMVILSSVLSYAIGIPLGIFLVVTDKNGIRPLPFFNMIVGVLINLLRAVPFMILLIMVLPFTRALVGTTIGAKAVIPQGTKGGRTVLFFGAEGIKGTHTGGLAGELKLSL